MMKNLLSVAFIFLVVFSGCSEEKKPDVLTNSQKEMFTYLPAETQFVLYMNLGELRKTEFWNDWFKPFITRDTLNNWMTDFEAKTGTGLKQGLAEIISATTWDGNDIFGVRFDANFEKVKAYFLNEAKFNQNETGGKKIFSLKDGSDAKFYFAKDDLLLILKNDEYLKQLLSGNNKSFDKENKLFSVIQKIKNKNHYWMATNKGGYAAGIINLLTGGKDIPVKKIISSVNEISLSAQFSDAVDINSVWGCSDVRHAYLLSTGVRSALAMDLLAGKDYALNQIMKKLEIDREAQDVHFEINLNKNDLAELKKLAEKKKLSQQKL